MLFTIYNQSSKMNKYIYIARPKEPVVIVDAEHYDNMDELSKLNKQEIETRAQELFKNYLKDVGVDIKIKYNTDKNLLYNNLVHVCYNDGECIRSNTDSFSISVMKDIVDSIVNDVNKKVKPIRKEILEELENRLTSKREKSKFWMNLCLTSNLVWVAATISILIILIVK